MQGVDITPKPPTLEQEFFNDIMSLANQQISLDEMVNELLRKYKISKK